MTSCNVILLFNYRRHRRRHRLKGIHSRSDTNRTRAEGLSFYYPRLLHCLDQILAIMLLNQHRVSSSKTVRPRASCGARCIRHAVSTWSAVCSEASHSQFGEGARSHLCMDKWNRPTPVRIKLPMFNKKCRNVITDKHLFSQLQTAMSSVKADINKIRQQKKFQISH